MSDIDKVLVEFTELMRLMILDLKQRKRERT